MKTLTLIKIGNINIQPTSFDMNSISDLLKKHILKRLNILELTKEFISTESENISTVIKNDMWIMLWIQIM